MYHPVRKEALPNSAAGQALYEALVQVIDRAQVASRRQKATVVQLRQSHACTPEQRRSLVLTQRRTLLTSLFTV